MMVLVLKKIIVQMVNLVPRVFFFFGQRGKPEDSWDELGKWPFVRFQTDTLMIRRNWPSFRKTSNLMFIQVNIERDTIIKNYQVSGNPYIS